jgi:hypothetical protein
MLRVDRCSFLSFLQILGFSFKSMRLIWEENIEMDVKDVVCEGCEWFKLAQDRAHWLAFLNRVMNLWVR